MHKLLVLFVFMLSVPAFSDTYTAKYDLKDSMEKFDGNSYISLLNSGVGLGHTLKSESGIECFVTIGMIFPDANVKAHELVFDFRKEAFKMNDYTNEIYKDDDIYGYYFSEMRLGPTKDASSALLKGFDGYIEDIPSLSYSDSPHKVECKSNSKFDYYDVREVLKQFFDVEREWFGIKEKVDDFRDYLYESSIERTKDKQQQEINEKKASKYYNDLPISP